MNCDIDKLNKIAKPMNSKSIEQRNWRMDNKQWLSLSAKISLKFRKYMKDNNITKEKLAEGLGVSLVQVNGYLSGKYNLDLRTIASICTVLNNKTSIIYNGMYINKIDGTGRYALLAFPTKEMRDAFYENFKEEIEQCKELL